MRHTRFDKMDCSIAQSLDQIGDWWSLLIVREVMLGKRRFSEFESALGISRNILTERLKRLVAVDVLRKQDVGKHGPHWEYALTEKGRDLFAVVTALRQWGDRWVYGDGDAPVVVKDRAKGRPIAEMRVTDEDGQALGLADVFIDPPLRD